MRTFRCTCGNTLYFENSQCLQCGRALGYVPAAGQLSAFEPGRDGTMLALHPDLNGQHFRHCRNHDDYQTCNWMVPVLPGTRRGEHVFCISCRLNQVIPDLGVPRRLQLWFEVEKAKRRLLYTLLSLQLPLTGHHQQSGGLAFQFLADARLDHAPDSPWGAEHINTGHHNGVITINLMEADPSLRERMRERLNETYRTLLGHFRHESGHYYWFALVANTGNLARFRQLFGDERRDYAATLDAYYSSGAPDDWPQRHISAYAASHPWEDFAETWAHYLHMMDTLETASDCAFDIRGRRIGNPLARVRQDAGLAPNVRPFGAIIDDWLVLTQSMNLLNRSMGLSDAYPFALTDPVAEKLAFIDGLVVG